MPDEFNDVYLNKGEEITANRRKRDTEVRGSILPFRKDEQGLHWALPKFITDVIDAVTLPRDVIQGYNPTDKDIANFGLNTMGGGIGASAVAKPEADVGMFLGTRAKGANIRKAEQAADMASRGIDKDRIWADTGWFQDRDGNWKWELSDDQAQFSPDAENSLDLGGRVKGPASKVLDHPHLFNQYSDASKYSEDNPLVIANMLDPKMSYDHTGSHEIGSQIMPPRIKAQAKTKEDLKKVMLHELQHAVQYKEGFEYGSNFDNQKDIRNIFLDLLPNDVKNFLALKEIVQKRARQLSVAEQAEKSDGPSGWQAIPGDNDLSVEELKQELQHYLPQFTETQDKIAPYMNELAPIFDYLEKDNWTNYARGSGEVEARNTSYRSNMTPEQRRDNPPWSTQDFSDDQITSQNQIEDIVRQAYNVRRRFESIPPISWKELKNDTSQSTSSRIKNISVDDFKNLLQNKKIRPASLDDVNGTHHQRPLYKHPNTGQYYVEVNNGSK